MYESAKDDIEVTNGSPIWVGLLVIAVASGAWLNAVTNTVEGPYLVSCSLMFPQSITISHDCTQDEVFHVGQAQTYCDGRFNEWDPKITTPPGL